MPHALEELRSTGCKVLFPPHRDGRRARAEEQMVSFLSVVCLGPLLFSCDFCAADVHLGGEPFSNQSAIPFSVPGGGGGGFFRRGSRGMSRRKTSSFTYVDLPFTQRLWCSTLTGLVLKHAPDVSQELPAGLRTSRGDAQVSSVLLWDFQLITLCRAVCRKEVCLDSAQGPGLPTTALRRSGKPASPADDGPYCAAGARGGAGMQRV